jgi:hypothetical protein
VVSGVLFAPVTWLGLGDRRAPTWAGAAFLVALACSTPEYHFVADTVDHCSNQQLDTALGETDIDCGGQDCHGCELGRQCGDSSDCTDGRCIDGFCQQPGCENSVLDGDETGIDCGGDCKPCRDGQPCLEATDCDSKVCGDAGLCASATCMDGVRNADELGADCGGAFCDDGCAIGTPCSEATDCESGLCDASTAVCALNCKRGTDECDGDLDTPCETNLLASSDNCGACGHVCDLSHANSSCTGGVCQIETCVKPWLRCNTDDGDGCEVNGSTDSLNCGSCGNVCPDFHGTPRCANSKCLLECDDDFGDCDGDPATGCEASLNDVDNCGACGTACPDTDGTPNCVGGKCGHADCGEGFGDCSGDQQCATNLLDDPSNCGRCGNICGAANGKAECVGGKCAITSCDGGFDNCDFDAEDGGYATGCETSLLGDAKHCGSCAIRCDVVAHGTGTCAAGVCALNCEGAFDDCDGKVSNGCETDTTSDPSHCGGCKNACSIPNATPACVNSGCVVDQCTKNHADCNAADGCETDVSSSVQHCGSCTGTCSSAGAVTTSCSNAKCDAPVCDANHLSCDDENENGCETDITTAANCGACGNACAGATPNCVPSGGSYQCQAKITLANTSPYPTASAAAGSLSFNVTPHAGTNRLLLVAIVSDALRSNAVSAGIAGARPGAVTFGTQNMIAGPSQAGVDDGWSPDLFVYYLPLGDASGDGAAGAIGIGGSTGPANVVVAQVLQLNGVRQSMPVTSSVGGFLGAPDPADPGVVASALPVAVSGSVIYSFISDYWDTRTCAVGASSSGCPAWSVTPAANLTLIETMATAPLTFYPPNSGNAPMRAFGMLVTAASPVLPAAASYTPSWSDPNPGRLTHLSVVIAPAQSR